MVSNKQTIQTISFKFPDNFKNSSQVHSSMYLHLEAENQLKEDIIEIIISKVIFQRSDGDNGYSYQLIPYSYFILWKSLKLLPNGVIKW